MDTIYEDKFENIMNNIFHTKKYKKAKTSLFDWLYEITNIRPGRIVGRGQSLHNIIHRFHENGHSDNHHLENVNSIVKISTLSSTMVLCATNHDKNIFKDSLRILVSAKKFIPDVYDETKIQYYRQLIKLKIYNGHDIDWDTYPEVVKNDEECKFEYIRYLDENFKATREEIIDMINPLFFSNNDIIKAFCYITMAVLHSLSDKEYDYSIDSKTKEYAKNAKKSTENTQLKIVKNMIRSLYDAIVSQNKLYHISSKKIYLKVKDRATNLLKNLETEKDIISMLRILHHFLLLSMNMNDIMFSFDLILKFKEIYKKYEVKYCLYKLEIINVLIDMIKNLFNHLPNNEKNEMNLEYYQIISNSFCKYIDSFPHEIKNQKNAYNFLKLGYHYKSMEKRPNNRDLYFTILKKFLKKLLKDINYKLIKTHPLFQ